MTEENKDKTDGVDGAEGEETPKDGAVDGGVLGALDEGGENSALADALARLEVAEAAAAESDARSDKLMEKVELYERDQSINDDDEEDDEQVQLSEGPWSKKPKAQMKRVFRVAVTKFPKGVPYKPHFKTLMTPASVTPEGVGLPSLVVGVDANPALQYVLIEGAVKYDLQLAAFRTLEAKGYIQEINPKHEGAVWLPGIVRAAEKAKVEFMKLQVKLAAM